MHDTTTKQQFVELRAQGVSFAAIAERLGVAKSTLVDWSFELKRDIANLKAMEHEALLEQYRLTNVERIKTTATILERVRTELDKRNFQDVPTPKLVELASHLEAQAQHAVATLTLTRKGIFAEIDDVGDTVQA